MALAAVWEHWLHPSGSEILSVALLTTSANKVMEPIHNRMPVILPQSSWTEWLDTGNVKPTMKPFLKVANQEEGLVVHPVSREVNKSTVEGPELIQPLKDISPPPKEDGEQLDLFGN